MLVIGTGLQGLRTEGRVTQLEERRERQGGDNEDERPYFPSAVEFCLFAKNDMIPLQHRKSIESIESNPSSCPYLLYFP